MRKSFLAHIAANFISQYKNAANSGVCYLLNEYSAARTALQNIFGVEHVPSRYAAEVSSKVGVRRM